MKSSIFAAILLAFLLNSTIAAEAAANADTADSEVDVNTSSDTDNVDATTTHTIKNADFCFFAGTPQSDIQYVTIRKLKVAKGAYGGVKDILPKFAATARKVGADAIINYTGSQRFGFFPWRTVRPVVRGVAIKWVSLQKPECGAVGGTTLKEILDTDRPPAQ